MYIYIYIHHWICIHIYIYILNITNVDTFRYTKIHINTIIKAWKCHRSSIWLTRSVPSAPGIAKQTINIIVLYSIEFLTSGINIFDKNTSDLQVWHTHTNSEVWSDTRSTMQQDELLGLGGSAFCFANQQSIYLSPPNGMVPTRPRSTRLACYLLRRSKLPTE